MSFPDAPSPVFFDMPRLDISSSQLRRRVAEGRSIRHFVPDPVAEHIARGRLYR
jgi:nicotinate-nucleotide adenylyltransferase